MEIVDIFTEFDTNDLIGFLFENAIGGTRHTITGMCFVDEVSETRKGEANKVLGAELNSRFRYRGIDAFVE